MAHGPPRIYELSTKKNYKGFSVTLFENSVAYVLEQVRKDDNNTSNEDALNHKVVPSDRLNKFVNNKTRSGYMEENNVKVDTPSQTKYKKKIAPPERDNESDIPDSDVEIVDVLDMVVNKVKLGKSGPVFRGKNEDYLLKTETVNLRSGNRSLYTLNSGSVGFALKEILSSKTLHKYIDKLSKTAAAYRTMENDSMDYNESDYF